MSVINKNKNISLLIFVFLFICILAMFTIYEKLFIILFFCLFLMIDFFLTKFFGYRLELRILLYLLIFFLIFEFVSGQGDAFNYIRRIFYIVEALLLLLAALIAMINNPFRKAKESNILTIILISLICTNFIGSMITYGDFNIFLLSTFDYCKYFLLTYFAMLSKIDDKEILSLLRILSPLIIICTILAIFQFFGFVEFFEPFVGRFDITARSGVYRSIGFFPHPIDLGNYSSVLFCLYYYLNKYKYKSKWLFCISVLLVLNIILSGTRTALIALLIILIISSLKSIKQTIISVIALTIILFALNNIIGINSIINSTSSQYLGDTASPREYFLLKGINVWKDHAIFGIGFATYGSMKYRERTEDKIFNEYDIHAWDFANLRTTDTFMAQLLPEFGIIGLLLLSSFALFIYSRYREIFRVDNSNKAYIYVFLSCSILSLNTSSAFFSPHVGTLFWLSMGLILNNYFIKNSKSSK